MVAQWVKNLTRVREGAGSILKVLKALVWQEAEAQLQMQLRSLAAVAVAWAGSCSSTPPLGWQLP